LEISPKPKTEVNASPAEARSGATFQAGPRPDLDLFAMILSFGDQGGWRHESVEGAYWRVRF
jgi:hypothetical protein